MRTRFLIQNLRWMAGCGAFLALGCDAAAETRGAETPRPVVLQVELEDETITPVVARFLRRAIRDAEQEQAEALLIVLDTPGGLVHSTRAIVRDILASRVPVVIYVAPSGARAASAGVFVTLSAHVAAMAPGTTIGAAHPVRIGRLPVAPEPADEDDDEPAPRPAVEEKLVSDTVGWARVLAELRGRNADWAARAVRQSVTATNAEALDEGVIDLVAADIPQLFAEIHGREVALPHATVTLNTAEAQLRPHRMWWGDQLLTRIANPNIAFLLLMLGFYGILFELYSPGWGVAGTLGIVALLLAFFGLAMLPINYIGLVLVFVALGLFAAEVFVTSYGALTVAGLVCMIVGAMMLVESPEGFVGVTLPVIIPVAAATAAITLFLVGSIVRSHRGRVQVGGETLSGSTATAVGDFAEQQGRYRGTARVQGEIWQAECDRPVSAGQPLRIRKRIDLTLVVEPEES